MPVCSYSVFARSFTPKQSHLFPVVDCFAPLDFSKGSRNDARIFFYVRGYLVYFSDSVGAGVTPIFNSITSASKRFFSANNFCFSNVS